MVGRRRRDGPWFEWEFEVGREGRMKTDSGWVYRQRQCRRGRVERKGGMMDEHDYGCRIGLDVRT